VSKRKTARNGGRLLDAAALDDLCAFIAGGGSLRAWAEANGHNVQNVHKWLLADEERNKLYREARKHQADAHIDQLIELADAPVPVDDQGRTDSAAVNQLRLRVDTRKWIASKYHPGLYGERVAVDANVNTNLAALPPDQIMGRIVDLLGKHGLKVVPADTGSSDGSDESR
jgi:hypothetical protein